MMRKVFYLLVLSAVFFATSTVLAQTDRTEYNLLAPIPYADTNGDLKVTAAEYIPGAVRLVIILSGVLAVVMIMVGGIQYMSTEAISGKSEAKRTIQNAFWGLGLVLGAFALLYTINPKLLKLNIQLQRFAPPAVERPGVTDPPPDDGDGEDGGGGGEVGDGIIPPPPVGTDCFYKQGLYGPNANSLRRYPACPSNTPSMTDLRTISGLRIPCKSNDEAGLNIPCKVDTGAVNYVIRLIGTMNGQGVGWTITDAYPPTAYHESNCHFNGGCIDVAPRPKIEENTREKREQFIKLCRALKAAGSVRRLVNEFTAHEDVVRECGPLRKYEQSTGAHIHVIF